MYRSERCEDWTFFSIFLRLIRSKFLIRFELGLDKISVGCIVFNL